MDLIFCSLAHCQPSLKFSCKSVPKFLRKVANRQTNKQRRLDLFGIGGGNSEREILPLPNKAGLNKSSSIIYVNQKCGQCPT